MLIGTVFNLRMALGSMEILTILILPVHEHGIFFHLSVSSSMSFISVLQLSVHRLFASLVKIVSKYFIVFDTYYCEWDGFLYFFSAIL